MRRLCPNLMTRFREEHYDTKAHKAWVKAGCPSDQGPEEAPKGPQGLRREHFRQSPERRYQIRKAKTRQAALQGRMI